MCISYRMVRWSAGSVDVLIQDDPSLNDPAYEWGTMAYEGSFGPDVLIHPEEILRIVGFLDLCKARVVGTKG